MSDVEKPWHSKEAADSYRKWFPVFPNYAAFDTVGIGEEEIGLPAIASPDLKKKVIAAAIASKLRITLNYAEKRYAEDADISPPRDVGLTGTIDTIFDYGHSRLCAYVEALKDNFTETETFDDLSNQFFYRNMGGLEAAKRISELGYLCEVAVVLRSLVEQFAFSAKLRTLPLKVDLAKARPVECLNYFKSIEPSAGRLYGLLSKYTHFEFDHHTHFFSRAGTEIFTIQKDSVLRAYSTHLIFMTMQTAANYVLAAARNQFVTPPDEVRELREFKRMIERYSKEVCELFPTDTVLRDFDRAMQAYL